MFTNEPTRGHDRTTATGTRSAARVAAARHRKRSARPSSTHARMRPPARAQVASRAHAFEGWLDLVKFLIVWALVLVVMIAVEVGGLYLLEALR